MNGEERLSAQPFDRRHRAIDLPDWDRSAGVSAGAQTMPRACHEVASDCRTLGPFSGQQCVLAASAQ